MPIELGEVKQESQEVKDLKDTIKKVAKAYTDRHGWCNEVNNALRDAGITDSSTMMEVDIDVLVTAKIPVRLDVGNLKGKTQEEINKHVQDLLPRACAAPYFSGSRNDTEIANTALQRTDVEPYKVDWQVQDINQFVPPPPPRTEIDDFMERINLDWEFYRLGFTSREGRVMHIVNRDRWDRGYSAACHNGSPAFRQAWSRTSTRSEHRVCVQCLRTTGATLQPAGEE